MQKNLLFKLLTILGLTILIFISIAMISDTIEERSGYRQQAIASIAADSVREQTITGPMLVISYVDQYEEAVPSAKDGAPLEPVTRTVQRQHLVFPNDLKIAGVIDTDRRYRGIHQVLVYAGQYAMSGDFVLPLESDLPRHSDNSRITVGKARIALGIDDVRGIRNIPKLSWGGRLIEFEQGTGLTSVPSGLHADLGALALAQPAQIRFGLDLGLDGIERQHFVPVGKNNMVSLKSSWPHPQFGGRFLPSARNRIIDENGFSAHWAISSLSTSAQQQIKQNESSAAGPQQAQALDRFGVGFIEPVNVYSLAERATKYGLLFVALTFAAFFIFEVLKRLPIHPVQYLLVGLALALFFLLLVGLSEHIAFILAYLIASFACIVLIGFYLAHVLRDWRRGLGFGAALTMLYGALYGLLISESNALVLGSILLFAVLAAVMVATRKVDWYQIGKAEPV